MSIAAGFSKVDAMHEHADNKETTKSRSLSKRLAYTFAALLLFFAALAAAEIILRVKDVQIHTGDEIYFNRLFYAKVAKSPFQLDEYITLGAKVYPFTPDYYRIENDPTPKKEDEILILCMGDSCAWGLGVEADQTYCSLLPEKLHQRFPQKKFRSLNAGRPGYTSYQGKVLYEKIVPYLKPDFVLFHFGANDYSGAPIRADKDWEHVPLWALKAHRWLYLNARVYQVFTNINLDYMRRRVMHPVSDNLNTNYHPRVSETDFNAYLDFMRENTVKTGARFIVISSVGWHRDKVFKNPYYVNKSLDDADLDAYALFSKVQKEQNHFVDSVHYNALGHQLVAEILADKIAKSLLSGVQLEIKSE